MNQPTKQQPRNQRQAPTANFALPEMWDETQFSAGFDDQPATFDFAWVTKVFDGKESFGLELTAIPDNTEIKPSQFPPFFGLGSPRNWGTTDGLQLIVLKDGVNLSANCGFATRFLPMLKEAVAGTGFEAHVEQCVRSGNYAGLVGAHGTTKRHDKVDKDGNKIVNAKGVQSYEIVIGRIDSIPNVEPEAPVSQPKTETKSNPATNTTTAAGKYDHVFGLIHDMLGDKSMPQAQLTSLAITAGTKMTPKVNVTDIMTAVKDAEFREKFAIDGVNWKNV